MQSFTRLTITLLALAATATAVAQSASSPADEAEQLKIAALEALIAAPADRALPIVARVLDGNHSDEVKSRALFILSQISEPEAQNQLLEFARRSDGEIRDEAIRMIGIGGNPDALAQLRDLYAGGDENLRDAILEAYLIADNKEGVYEIAAGTSDPGEFEAAVEILGAMGARDELRRLRDKAGISNSLIEAYAISGDIESLREIVRDSSDIERQVRAIEALGIAGTDDVGTLLVDIYRDADVEEIKLAALEGLMIAGEDAALLELYRSSGTVTEKRRVLEALTMTGSDLLLDVIDEALAGGQ